jgi:purine nucleoside permease
MKLIPSARLFVLMLAALMFGLARASAAVAEDGKIEVRAVVVANFENGADMGDAPGEFQFWAEREHLDEAVPVRGAPNAVRRNAQGLYGLITHHGVTDLVAFVLDPRFDFSKTYWLFTGISGIDPRAGTVGSVAWARWVVNGDELREVDDREIPKDWPYGLWAIGATKPNQLPYDPNHFGSVTDVSELSMAYPLNPKLTQWAYDLTKDVALGDTPVLQSRRTVWVGYPNALAPPRVMLGETLGSVRYFDGVARTQWAEDWVKLWTGGRGLFVMANMESQTDQAAMRVLASERFVDPNRIMVLRSASDFSAPPPGAAAVTTIGDEEPGQIPAFDNNYRAGAPVLHALLSHWDKYRDTIPGGAP